MEEETYTVFKHVIGRDYCSYTGVESIEMRVSKEAGMDQMMQAFKGFLLAIGYHPNSVREYIEDE